MNKLFDENLDDIRHSGKDYYTTCAKPRTKWLD
jgi:hypothetical protein